VSIRSILRNLKLNLLNLQFNNNQVIGNDTKGGGLYLEDIISLSS
jgi:hypothetical protein